MVSENSYLRILANLRINKVPQCVNSDAESLGLYKSHLSEVSAENRLADSVSIAHRRTDKLIVRQNTACYGQFISPA